MHQIGVRVNVPREMLRNTHTIYSLNGMWSSEGWSQYQPVQDKLGGGGGGGGGVAFSKDSFMQSMSCKGSYDSE